MTTPIEPTEEQMQAAKRFVHSEFGHAPSIQFMVPRTARLLAEREHKLREDLTAQCSPDVDMCGGCSACVHWVRANRDRLAADLDAARARIADLEASTADLLKQHYLDLHSVKAANAREAAHLAHIKALRETLRTNRGAVCFWVENSGSPSFYLKDLKALDAVLADTAHYDAEGAVAGNPVTASPDCPRESPECVTVGFHAVDECERRSSSFPAECPKCQEGTHPFFDVKQNRWLCDRCHHPAGEPFVHVDVEGGEG